MLTFNHLEALVAGLIVALLAGNSLADDETPLLQRSIDGSVINNNLERTDNATGQTNPKLPEESSGTKQIQPEICSTDLCNRTAQRIRGYVNFSADPCDDFFDYACGNFIATKYTGLSSEVSLFVDLRNVMRQKIQDLLSNNNKSDMFASEIQAKNMFAQCKNKVDLEKFGIQPLLNMLNETIGGWPILNPNWNASNFDLFRALSKIKELGEASFISVTVDQDVLDPTKNIIVIGEPEAFVKKDILLGPVGVDYVKSYLTYVSDVASLMLTEIGAQSNDTSGLTTDFKDLLDLGQYISLADQTLVEKQDVSWKKNQTTLGLIQAATFTRSSLFRRMIELLNDFFSHVDLGSKIGPDTPAVLRYSSFFDKVDEKLLDLEKLGDNGSRLLANYIGWRIIDNNIAWTPSAYKDAYLRHIHRVPGQEVKKQFRSSFPCSIDVVDTFPLAVGAVFVRDNIPGELKSKASTMINDLKSGFKELLDSASWMDSATHAAADRKLDALVTLVAYPDIMTNNVSAIDVEYQNLPMGTSYFATVQNAKRWKSEGNLKRLGKNNNLNDPAQVAFTEAFDVTDINAENVIEKNLVKVLAAILQRPFYETRNPQYLNYGGIGFVIGHEITHSFDDQGASYDEHDVMRVWWSNSTIAAYADRKQTFVDQYNAYNFSGSHVSGALTLSENIADNGGLKAAYRAYFNYFQKRLSNPEPLLPGFVNSTAEQMFFLAAAQMWCGKQRPDYERLLLAVDVHSPYHFRVVGPMSNIPEFSQAYSCAVGSNMNPPVKHAVW